MPHLNNKQNKNTNQIISQQEYHLTQPCPSEGKQKLSTNLPDLTQTTGPNLEGQKPEGRKNSTLKSGKRRPQTKSYKHNEKAEKYYTNEGTN